MHDDLGLSEGHGLDEAMDRARLRVRQPVNSADGVTSSTREHGDESRSTLDVVPTALSISCRTPMPHLQLEYSDNLLADDLPALADRLHRMLVDIGDIRLENCKTRWHACHGYAVAGGGPAHAFVHLSIRFLEGHKRNVRRKIGKAALSALRTHFRPPQNVDCQFTVEVGEIDPGLYFKHPPDTLSTEDSEPQRAE